MRLLDFPGRRTALDIGGATLRMHVAGRGIVASEPTVLARCTASGRTLGIGEQALAVAERRGGVELVRPVRCGVPCDTADVEIMVRKLLRTHHRSHYMARPHMAVTAPSVMTPLQEQTMEDVAYRSGARKVTVVPVPLAAAVGAGLAASGREVAAVADIGAHTTDVGVLAFGSLVASVTAPVGGDMLDRAIVSWVREERGLTISVRTAEDAKIAVGALDARGRRRRQRTLVHGKDLITGLPRGEVLTAQDVARAIESPVRAIADAVRRGLADCPPDMAAEMVGAGLTLTGGTARLPGLHRLLAADTGLPTRVAPNAEIAAVTGAAELLALPRTSDAKDVADGGARDWTLLSLPRQLWPARS
ncbi:Rod shape-determining protein MreB [Actinomadura rubteroloni]|uniref:Rod shape-determining protein MreB n=1 Tax=Actinomadura rubteroloni TaxID=1926885 RepID=A0A2P4UNT7_9ACTN|nr:rod shape-determining protein [Actinomadura rubteroloni]POM26689.1 Rod shape-determining protein MreB [Actinomadura rubteroloni]